MVLRRLLPMFAALVLLAMPASSLQASAAESQEGKIGVALAHRVEGLKRAYQANDTKAIALAVQEVELLRRDFGTLDVTPLVEAMCVWARARGDEGKVEEGLAVVQGLERWAPRHPAVLSARVVLFRQKGLMGYVEGLPDVMELTRLRLDSAVHRGLFLVQHVSWVRLMAIFLLWGWTLALIIRYRRVFRYTWEKPISKVVANGPVRGLLGAFLLALPALAGLDPGISAFLWLWLLIPFLYTQELKLTLLVVIFQVAHPLLALLEPSVVQRPKPSIVALQLRPSATPINWSAFKGLNASDKQYLEGWSLLQAQQWSLAEGRFRALDASHPHQAGILNNLGVSLYQMGQIEEAEQLFAKACALDPRSPEVLLNQSTLAYRRLDSATGTLKVDEARKASPERYAQLRDASQARTEQRTFAIPLSDSDERSEALLRHYGEGPMLPRNIHQAGLLLWAVMPLVIAGLFVFRARQALRQAHPTQCARCGEPFHTTDSPDTDVCSKCHHLFVVKDGLHGDARKAKVEEASSFQREQRWFHRVLLILLPGLDLIFLGSTRSGLVEFSLVALAAGIVLGTGRAIRYPGEILTDPSSLWLPFAMALLGLLYLRSWLKLILRRG